MKCTSKRIMALMILPKINKKIQLDACKGAIMILKPERSSAVKDRSVKMFIAKRLERNKMDM